MYKRQGQLVAGTQSAKDGSAQIASGAVQLEEGSGTLASGLTDAVDGSGELSTALADGAKTAAEQTTNIDGKSEVMSDPVELANEYYTTVTVSYTHLDVYKRQGSDEAENLQDHPDKIQQYAIHRGHPLPFI